MHLTYKSRSAGFTLLELVMVIVILAILAVYAGGSMYSPAEMSLSSQAQKMASGIGSARTLAYTSGTHMRFSITAGTNGTYVVYSCVVDVNGTSCPTTVIPLVTLQKDVILAGPATLDFTSLGLPSAAASYTLTFGTTTETISVAALTGTVAVTP